MHLQDGPQLDLSAHVAKVREKTRPWKSIIAFVLAIGAGVASAWAHHGFHRFFERGGSLESQVIAAVTAVAFCVFASIATYGLSGQARDVLNPRTGPSHAAVVRYVLLLAGAFATLVIALALFDVPVGQLLVGGALASVFVGIAAQQALGNVFAGMVLLFARPFRVGDTVQLRAGSLGGRIEGRVIEIGITYVRLDTGETVLAVPNSQVLNAAVGPLPPAGAESNPTADQAPPRTTNGKTVISRGSDPP